MRTGNFGLWLNRTRRWYSYRNVPACFPGGSLTPWSWARATSATSKPHKSKPTIGADRRLTSTPTKPRGMMITRKLAERSRRSFRRQNLYGVDAHVAIGSLVGDDDSAGGCGVEAVD